MILHGVPNPEVHLTTPVIPEVHPTTLVILNEVQDLLLNHVRRQSILASSKRIFPRHTSLDRTTYILRSRT